LAEDILTKKNIETRQPKIFKKKFSLDFKLKTVGPFPYETAFIFFLID